MHRCKWKAQYMELPSRGSPKEACEKDSQESETQTEWNFFFAHLMVKWRRQTTMAKIRKIKEMKNEFASGWKK